MIKLMDMHPKILGARFTIHIGLKILSGLEFDRAMIKVIKAGLSTVTMITVGDYCSVKPGVLQLLGPFQLSNPSKEVLSWLKLPATCSCATHMMVNGDRVPVRLFESRRHSGDTDE